MANRRGLRTLGGGNFTPLSMSGLAAWYKMTDPSTLFQDTARTSPVTADGQQIAGITDKSGNGRHLAQATAGNRPLYKIVSGVALSRHQDTSDGLTHASGPITGDSTLIAVCFPTGAAEGIILAQRQTGNTTPIEAQLAMNNTGSLSVDFRNDANALTRSAPVAATTLSTWYVLTGTYSGTTQTNFINGTQQDQDTNSGGAVTTDTIWVGTGDGTFGFTGDLKELLIYTRALSLNERQTVEHYLGAEHNISVS